MQSIQEIIKKIKQTAAKAENQEANRNTISQESNNVLDINDLYKYVVKTNEIWQINSEKPVISNRRFIGKGIQIIKKALRKSLRWYINPIVQQQNEFNSNVVNSLNRIANYLEKQEQTNKIQERINKNQEQINNIQEQSVKDINNNIIQALFKHADISLASGNYNMALLYAIEGIKADRNSEENVDILRSIIREVYKSENLDPEKAKTIAILCKGYKKEKTSEAIKKEAYTYFKAIKHKYNKVYFISFEHDEPKLRYDEEEEVYYCPYDNCFKEISKLSPSIVHIYEDSPYLLFLDDLKITNFNIVHTLTGLNPINRMDNDQIEEFLHLADMQKVTFVVESNFTKQLMEQKGFRINKVITPISEINVKEITRKENNMRNFTVGFASSPMLEKQYTVRGIDLIIETARKMPEVNFLISWRNKGVNIKGISDLKNVSVMYGNLDMNEFYGQCDTIVVPFTEQYDVHAFPLSAAEMLMSGKPVLCTDKVGLKDIIEEMKFGVVFDSKVDDFIKAVNQLRENYDMYVDNVKRNSNNIFNQTEYIQNYSDIYNNTFQNEIVSLALWKKVLRENNSELIKGMDNLKKYYQKNEVAKTYNDTRFKTFPMNCFNVEELEAIKIIVKEEKKQSELKLLDIACGDGRILKELIDYGRCTAIDSSAEMLKIALENINKKCKDPKLELITGDFFEVNVKNSFDVVTVFRYIRHYEYADRKRIYEKINNLLDSNGLLIFDAPNAVAEGLLRKHMGWENFNIYDVFWTPNSIKEELAENGYKVERIIPIGQGLLDEVPGLRKLEPLSWVVSARKK